MLMKRLQDLFDRVDTRITGWMMHNGIVSLRVSLGVVFLWFGALKFFPGLSPAEALAGKTIEHISFSMVGPQLSLPILAAWESLIGIGLVLGWVPRFTLLLLFLQMPGTVLPLFLFPHETWVRPFWVPTLEGQYIIKNLVLISAGFVIGATVRGAKIQPPLSPESR